MSNGAATRAHTCADCSPGNFSDITALTACKTCPLGYTQAAPSGENCTVCGMGRHESERVECTDCTPGFFADVAALGDCKACPSGYLQTASVGRAIDLHSVPCTIHYAPYTILTHHPLCRLARGAVCAWEGSMSSTALVSTAQLVCTRTRVVSLCARGALPATRLTAR
jgi:hypothetical protein